MTGNAHFTKLETRDRAFCRLLLTTVPRRLGQIDDALDRCLDRPIRPKDSLLRPILRLGAAPLLFLETASSEDRRVGKAGVSACRIGWSAFHTKKKTKKNKQ